MADPDDDIEYAESGSGPALLMVPGSFGTGAAWRGVIAHLNAGYRTVTTSLQGYGRTRDRRTAASLTMAEQIRLLDRLIERIGEPVHVVGHSFGALSALAHVLEGTRKPASLTLFEANPFTILRTAGDDAHAAMFGAMTEIYFREFAAGGTDAARHVIDFYEGDGAFDALPEKVRAYVVATTATNVRDWASAATFAPPLAAYAAIGAPTLLVRGGDGHPAMRRIADLLAAHIPGARLETIAGARHMLPATHPAEVAGFIAGHVKTTVAQPDVG